MTGTWPRAVRAVAVSLRELVAGRVGRALMVITVLAGAGAAFGISLASSPSERSLGTTIPLVQLVMSVLTPFSTARLTLGLERPPGPPARDASTDPAATGHLPSRWAAAAVYGVTIGAYGVAVAALATVFGGGVSPSTAPWAGAGSAVLGSLLVQLVPVGVGCAAGLLVPRIGLACLATIAVPLGVTALLGGVASGGVAGWVTPLGAAERVLTGPVGSVDLLSWISAAIVWVVVPNLIGARRLHERRRRHTPAAAESGDTASAQGARRGERGARHGR